MKYDVGESGGLRIHQALARELGKAIISGRHPPGANLGGEVEQSQQLKVSRTAYREAIRILVAKGLVESRPKAGTHVTPRSRWSFLDPDVLAWMFSQKPDRNFTRDLFELRRIIEPAAAELAAERRSETDVANMRAALDAMRAETLSTLAGQEADRQFHRSIFEAARNEALMSLAGSVGAAVQWTTHFKLLNGPEPRDPIDAHEAVFDAIASADPSDARTAMRELVDAALADMQYGDS